MLYLKCLMIMMMKVMDASNKTTEVFVTFNGAIIEGTRLLSRDFKWNSLLLFPTATYTLTISLFHWLILYVTNYDSFAMTRSNITNNKHSIALSVYESMQSLVTVNSIASVELSSLRITNNYAAQYLLFKHQPHDEQVLKWKLQK